MTANTRQALGPLQRVVHGGTGATVAVVDSEGNTAAAFPCPIAASDLAAADPVIAAGTLLIDPSNGLIYGQSDGAGGISAIGRDLSDVGSRVMGIKATGDNVSTGSSLATAKSWYVKIAIPADWDAIQLVHYRHDTSAGNITYRACIAATEVAPLTGATDMWQPIVGGSPVLTLDSTSAPNGWRTVTYSGASTVDIAAPSSAYAPTKTVSDIIQCPSVPSTDGNACRYLLIRINTSSATASVDYAPASLAGSYGEDVALTTYNGGQVLLGYFTNDAGAVYITAPQSNTPAATLNQTVPCFGLLVHARQRCMTVLGCGDSITQAKDMITAGDIAVHDRVSGFGRQACVLAQAATGVPFGWVNHGAASQNTAIFQPLAVSNLSTWRPDVLVYSAWTPNYGAYGSTDVLNLVVQRFRRYLAEMRQQCSLYGTTLIVWTGLPCPSTTISTSAIDDIRKAINAEWVAQGGNAQRVVDFSTLLGDGASPERLATSPMYGSEAYPNGLHPTLLGHQAMAARLAQVLAGLV